MTDCKETPPGYAWSDDYQTNINKLDEQHKALFATTGKLYKQLLEHKDARQTDRVFSDLVRQTVVHFKAEEELMQTHAYPDYPNHKEMHDMLVQQLKDIQSSQQSMKSSNYLQSWIERQEVADYLSGWLVNHIIDEDKKLGAFLRDSGLK